MAVKEKFLGSQAPAVSSSGENAEYRDNPPYRVKPLYGIGAGYEESPEVRKKARRITAVAIVAGISCALVAGLVVVFSLHASDAAAARQARAARSAQAAQPPVSRTAQAAGQLEKAASGLYQATASVYKYQVKCARTGRTWAVCFALSSGLAHFSATTATFDAGNFGLTDATVNSRIMRFEHASIGAVEASFPATAKRQWKSMVTAYKDLIKRCQQLSAAP